MADSDLRLLIRSISDDAGLRQMSASVARLGSDVQRQDASTAAATRGQAALGGSFGASAGQALRLGEALREVSQEAQAAQRAAAMQSTAAGPLKGSPAVPAAQSASILDSTRAIKEAELANRGHAAAVRSSEIANREQAASLRAAALAARQSGQAHKDAAVNVGGIGKGFDISAASVARFAGALTGVTLGLSLAASAGAKIRESITGAVQAQAGAERTARAVAASYGDAAQQFTRFAAALSTQTGFTSQAILEASLSARTLSENYGLSIAQTQKLIAVSADLAQIRGIGVAEAFERVQSAIRGEAEASEFLGLTLNATFLKNNALNGSLRTSFETMTDAQKAQVVYGEVLRQTAKFSGLAADANNGLDGAMTRANTSAHNLSVTLGKLIEPQTLTVLRTATVAMNELDAAIQRVQKSGNPANLLDALPPLPSDEDLQRLGRLAGTDFTATITALRAIRAFQQRPGGGDQPFPTGLPAGFENEKLAGELLARSVPAAQKFGDAIQAAHKSFQQIAQDISDIQSKSATLSTIAGALGLSDTATRATLAALQDVETVKARIRAQDAAAQAELERSRSLGARSAEGSAAAQERNRLLDQLVPAEQARAVALLAQSDAQKQVSALELSAQQRQLAVAQPLADLRTETLLREIQIAEVQQKEADLADRITQASRQNLDLVRQSAQAKLDALPSGEALNDNQFESQQLKLENKAIRADVRRGVLDRSALDDIRPNRQRITELRREAPRLESDAFNSARAGELLDRQATREQLTQTITLSILEGQKRVLDDQNTALRQAQALTDARVAAIQRGLELQQAGETSARTAAQQQLLSANQAVTAAEALVQKSIEWGANIGSTLQNIRTAAQELATLPQPSAPPPPPVPPPPAPQPYTLSSLPTDLPMAVLPAVAVPPPPPTAPLVPGTPPGGFVNPDRQRAGAGSASAPSTNTTTVTVNMTFTGPVNDPQAIAQEVLTALSNAADRAPKASPTGLAGAI